MFGQVTDLPRFNNYAEALNYFNKTKGMRGRAHIKPLKTSRRCPDDYKIDMNPNGGVECWLYQTPVLTYYPTHLVVNTYDSRTTCCFIDSIAPSWMWAHIHQNTQIICVADQTPEGAAGQFIGTRVEVVVDENYRPIKGSVRAAKLDKVVLNRTRAAESRKQCKEVIELARITSKIDGYWDALMKSEEVESLEQDVAWLRNILKIGGYYAHERWDGSMVHAGFRSWGERSAEALLPKLKQWLYKTTYNSNEAYDYIPAEYGVVPKDWRVAE